MSRLSLFRILKIKDPPLSIKRILRGGFKNSKIFFNSKGRNPRKALRLWVCEYPPPSDDFRG